MRGSRAKKIRRLVWAPGMSMRGTQYRRDEHGNIRCTGKHEVYKRLKSLSAKGPVSALPLA